MRLSLGFGLVLTLALAGCQDGAAGGGGGAANSGPDQGGSEPSAEVGQEASANVDATEAEGESVVDEAPADVAADVPAADASSPEQRAPAPAPLDAIANPDSWTPPIFEEPEAVRGLYLNAWTSGSRKRSDALIELAKRTEINALVIDIKDATGFLSHRSGVELARDVGATGEIRIRDLTGLLQRVADAGLYPIARIVVTKDPLLSQARPEWAIQDTAGGIWTDAKGVNWLNPYNQNVWDYHVAIAREVAELGFPEIQWDYVRFPDAAPSYMERAAFPGADGRTRAQGIRSFLQYSGEALSDVDVKVTADVFGVTTSFSNDVGIGQHWESFIDVIDVALPMVYPSHYSAGSYGLSSPNAHPYEVVKAAMDDAVRRSGSVENAGRIRPWIQDFDLGQPRYDAPEVRAQIQAAYDAGVDEWILWNPGARYTEEALRPAGARHFDPEIRVRGEIVRTSERMDVLTAVASDSVVVEGEAKPDQGETAAPGTGNGVTADTTGVGR